MPKVWFFNENKKKFESFERGNADHSKRFAGQHFSEQVTIQLLNGNYIFTHDFGIPYRTKQSPTISRLELVVAKHRAMPWVMQGVARLRIQQQQDPSFVEQVPVDVAIHRAGFLERQGAVAVPGLPPTKMRIPGLREVLLPPETHWIDAAIAVEKGEATEAELLRYAIIPEKELREFSQILQPDYDPLLTRYLGDKGNAESFLELSRGYYQRIIQEDGVPDEDNLRNRSKF